MGAMNTYLVENLFSDFANNTIALQNTARLFFSPLDEFNTTLKFSAPRWVNKDVWLTYAQKYANYTSLLPTIQLNSAEG